MEIFEPIARPRSEYLSVLPERRQHITRDADELRSENGPALDYERQELLSRILNITPL
jgi:hypothetical protein